jgi:hypothetical protein
MTYRRRCCLTPETVREARPGLQLWYDPPWGCQARVRRGQLDLGHPSTVLCHRGEFSILPLGRQAGNRYWYRQKPDANLLLANVIVL